MIVIYFKDWYVIILNKITQRLDEIKLIYSRYTACIFNDEIWGNQNKVVGIN